MRGGELKNTGIKNLRVLHSVHRPEENGKNNY